MEIREISMGIFPDPRYENKANSQKVSERSETPLLGFLLFLQHRVRTDSAILAVVAFPVIVVISFYQFRSRGFFDERINLSDHFFP